MEPMLISAMDKPLQPWRNGGGGYPTAACLAR